MTCFDGAVVIHSNTKKTIKGSVLIITFFCWLFSELGNQDL